MNPAPEQRQPRLLSFVIPIYNGAATITEVVAEIQSVDAKELEAFDAAAEAAADSDEGMRWRSTTVPRPPP